MWLPPHLLPIEPEERKQGYAYIDHCGHTYWHSKQEAEESEKHKKDHTKATVNYVVKEEVKKGEDNEPRMSFKKKCWLDDKRWKCSSCNTTITVKNSNLVPIQNHIIKEHYINGKFVECKKAVPKEITKKTNNKIKIGSPHRANSTI